MLQGKGAFGMPGAVGSPSPPTAPKKEYKWKIPSEEEKPADAPEASEEDTRTTSEDKPLVEEPEDIDPEASNRAAIAARMAKLGGAKFGMGPPVYTRKDSKKEEEPEPEGEFFLRLHFIG